MDETGTNSILIVDDDPGVIKTVVKTLSRLEVRLDWAVSLAEGLEKAGQENFDVVLLDVNLPDGNGIEQLSALLQRDLPPLVIVMTAYCDPDGAQLAIESGAWDYLAKPVSPKELRLQVFRALEYQRQARQATAMARFDAPEIVGKSLAIQNCLAQAARIISSDGNVLITGETGTGKELFARAIHNNSGRRNGAFIVVDCSVLSETLIESVLFGHEKGAFTGADRNRKGLVALANGGTLFLDEVGELPESMQSSFLRVLQEKAFRPVGSEQEIFSDFRVICATNRNIDEMADAGRFRFDLLYRLKTFVLHLPPLRERKDDIQTLFEHQIEKTCRDHKVPAKTVSEDLIEALKGYDWPGNVRELINTIERTVTAAHNEPTLFAFHLPAKIRAKVVRSRMDEPRLPPSKVPANAVSATHREAMERAEKDYLRSVYAAEAGDIQQMLEKTALSRTVLYRKLKKFNIK